VAERKEVTEKLYPGLEGKEWEDEVERHWGNMAPHMRGSFANPPPGVPLSEVGGEKGGRVENEAVGKGGEEEKARRNFRVGVLVPEVVERVALSEDFGKAKRWVWDKDDGGKWRETELWP
jgi:pyridoxamine 5'-phosphate oxidase